MTGSDCLLPLFWLSYASLSDASSVVLTSDLILPSPASITRVQKQAAKNQFAIVSGIDTHPVSSS